jgi:hypothetical protein
MISFGGCIVEDGRGYAEHGLIWVQQVLPGKARFIEKDVCFSQSRLRRRMGSAPPGLADGKPADATGYR